MPKNNISISQDKDKWVVTIDYGDKQVGFECNSKVSAIRMKAEMLRRQKDQGVGKIF